MIDRFFGYNQISINKQDKEKTTFTTPWGTFMYDKIPFGLMNVGATFQRDMDLSLSLAKGTNLWLSILMI